MKTIKNAKKTFIAVSMVAFAAMMFSCAGTKKTEAVTDANVSVQENVPETSFSETEALENQNSQTAGDNAGSAAPTENAPAENAENAQSGEGSAQ